MPEVEEAVAAWGQALWSQTFDRLLQAVENALFSVTFLNYSYNRKTNPKLTSEEFARWADELRGLNRVLEAARADLKRWVEEHPFPKEPEPGALNPKHLYLHVTREGPAYKGMPGAYLTKDNNVLTAGLDEEAQPGTTYYDLGPLVEEEPEP